MGDHSSFNQRPLPGCHCAPGKRAAGSRPPCRHTFTGRAQQALPGAPATYPRTGVAKELCVLSPTGRTNCRRPPAPSRCEMKSRGVTWPVHGVLQGAAHASGPRSPHRVPWQLAECSGRRSPGLAEPQEHRLRLVHQVSAFQTPWGRAQTFLTTSPHGPVKYNKINFIRNFKMQKHTKCKPNCLTSDSKNYFVELL